MLHIITRLVRGGADENTLYTVRGLDPRRYAVDLVVGAGSEPECLEGLDPARVIHMPELVRDPHPLKDAIALARLAGVVRRGHYQIVHTHTAKAGFLGRLAAALAATPIIIHTVHGVTFHDHLPRWQRWFYLTLERIAARFTHQFVTVGEDVKSIYLRAGIGEASAYETIYSGMPLEEYLEAGDMSDLERAQVRRELGLEPRHQVVAMAARLEARKGHGYLFEAVSRMRDRHPDLRVLILGDGADRAALERRTREAGIDDIVRFLGHRLDLPRVLAAADISVLTSLWEGLPRVLVQSAAAGKPILTFDVEGAWEVVRDGQNGFIVPTRDVEAFARRLDQMLSDRTGCRVMGRSGRLRVSEAWTVETMLDRLDLLYQRCTTDRAA
jgi:glycosyltransferase involved in cell wall biosynthesis